ncbi:MAG: tRNA pseudouridine(55) synthase TruB [Spirochaetales bacterium]|nr:tRNA pseudouridine(55) synthase TruB [Spirochaetales bacterium]
MLNKSAGQTSFQSLGAVKRLYGTKKVGHTGTLDKFATGLMIVLVGKYTRLNPLFTGMDKTYEAVIRFGEETDTLDPEGAIIAVGNVPSLDTIKEVLPRFLGDQDQVPPAYSAVHINGKRSWKLARQGVQVEMKSRPVRIDELEVLAWEEPDLTLRVSCSSGTYIRSLARDLALACESRARLEQLCRTRVGQFSLNEANVIGSSEGGSPELFSLASVKDRLPLSGTLILDREQEDKVRLGIPPERFFSENDFDSGLIPLFSGTGDFMALMEKEGRRLRYRFVM